MLRNKFFQKSFIALFLVFSSFSLAVRPVHAGLKEWLYEKAEDIIPELDITKTVQSILIESLTGFTASAITDRNLDEISNCFLVAHDIYSPEGIYTHPSGGTPTNSLTLPNVAGDADKEALILAAWEAVQAYDPSVCDFDNTHMFGGIGNPSNSPAESALPTGVGIYRGSGSMLSVASSLRNSVVNEPLPVNMAFFFKDYARRIPIIQNSAYAQTQYNIIGGETVYDIWVLSRNVSLALMSLVLLVIGVMIMTRKKINPQAVVTVQNALPRIAMGITLVFFSYPIGAFFATLFTPLCWNALWLVFSLIGSTGTAGNLNILLYTTFYSSIADPRVGVGLFAIVSGILMLLVCLVVLIVVLIRSLLIYMKILVSIIVAPIQFTLGVLPGKENFTLDWFKSIIADVLSAPAMFLMISIAWLFGYVSFTGTVVDWNTAGGSFGEDLSRLFSALFTPMIMLFCLMTALKMPGKVQKIIMGDKKR